MYDHPLFSQVAGLPPGLNLMQGFDSREAAAEMVRDLREFCRERGLRREISLGADGFSVRVKSSLTSEK